MIIDQPESEWILARESFNSTLKTMIVDFEYKYTFHTEANP